MLERPEDFRINIHSPLADGLVFAGLGRRGSDKTKHYHDSSLHGNDGSLTNMDPATDWVWVPELGRWGLEFHSVSYVRAEYVTVPLSPNPGPDTHKTLSLWIYQPSAVSSAIFGGVHFNYQSLYGYGFNCRNDGTLRCVASAGTTDVYDNVYGTLPSGQWSHAAMTATGKGAGNTLTLFINGHEIASYTGTITDYNYACLIHSHITTSQFVGPISDPLIYSRALSPSEVAQLADPSNVMLSGLVLPPRRKLWAVVSGETPSANIPVFMHHRRLIGAV